MKRKKKNKKPRTHHCRNNSKIQLTNRRNKCKIDSPNAYIRNRSTFLLGTGTSIRSGGVELDLLNQTYHLVK